MALNPQALASLSEWQRKVLANTVQSSGAQRAAQGATGTWDAYRAALAGSPPTPPAASTAVGAVPTPDPAPSAQGGGGGGGSVGVGAAFRQAGGRKGAGMDLAAFRKWYDQVMSQTGMDPASWAKSAGLNYGGELQKGVKGISAGAGANIFSPGDRVQDFSGSMGNEAAQALGLRLTGAKSIDDLALAQGFAGVEQYGSPWEDPLASGGRRGSLPLRNTSMVDLRYDDNAMDLALGALLGMSPEKAKQRYAEQQKLVPDWAPGVDQELRQANNLGTGGQGIPFGFELFGNPGGSDQVNSRDPSQPLFGAGERPLSLSQLGVLQQGEASYLRSLGAPEIADDIWKHYYANFHRPAGAPVPEGYEAGMTFGSPVGDPAHLRGGYDPETGTPEFAYNFTRSPLQGLYGGPQTIGADVLKAQGIEGEPKLEDLLGLAGGYYNRWAAYGMPGDPTQQALSQALTAGQEAPEGWSGGPNPYPKGSQQWESFQRTEDVWQRDRFQNPLYAPWIMALLPEEVRKRLQTLAGSPTVSSAELF